VAGLRRVEPRERRRAEPAHPEECDGLNSRSAGRCGAISDSRGTRG
jgi:hypothetical protein